MNVGTGLTSLTGGMLSSGRDLPDGDCGAENENENDYENENDLRVGRQRGPAVSYAWACGARETRVEAPS